MKIVKTELVPATNLTAKYLYVKFDDGLIGYVTNRDFELYGLTKQNHVTIIRELQKTI